MKRVAVIGTSESGNHAWFPRLLRRTLRRSARHEVFLNGNRETVRDAFFSRDSLLLYAARTHRVRRRSYPAALAPYNVVRLRSQREVDRFLASARPKRVKGS